MQGAYNTLVRVRVAEEVVSREWMESRGVRCGSQPTIPPHQMNLRYTRFELDDPRYRPRY